MADDAPVPAAPQSGGLDTPGSRQFWLRLLFCLLLLNLTAIGLWTASLGSSHREEIRQAELRTRNRAEAADKSIGAPTERSTSPCAMWPTNPSSP